MSLVDLDTLEIHFLLFGHGAPNAEGHELRVAANGVERRAPLVRHHGQEMRLRLVRMLGVRSRAAFALQQVLTDGTLAQQLVGLLLQRHRGLLQLLVRRQQTMWGCWEDSQWCECKGYADKRGRLQSAASVPELPCISPIGGRSIRRALHEIA